MMSLTHWMPLVAGGAPLLDAKRYEEFLLFTYLVFMSCQASIPRFLRFQAMAATSMIQAAAAATQANIHKGKPV